MFKRIRQGEHEERTRIKRHQESNARADCVSPGPSAVLPARWEPYPRRKNVRKWRICTALIRFRSCSEVTVPRNVERSCKKNPFGGSTTYYCNTITKYSKPAFPSTVVQIPCAVCPQIPVDPAFDHTALPDCFDHTGDAFGVCRIS